MSEPIRLTVLKALVDQIEERAGLTGAVFRGRTFFGPASGGPKRMVSIFEDGVNAVDYAKIKDLIRRRRDRGAQTTIKDVREYLAARFPSQVSA